MRFFDGNIYRDMTPKEESEHMRHKAEQEEYDRLHPAPPTETERIVELESRLDSFETAYQRGVDEA